MQSTFYASTFLDLSFVPLEQGLTTKLDELVKQHHQILTVAFQHDGSAFQQSPGMKHWVIVTDQGVYPNGISGACALQLKALHDAGHQIHCVAFTLPTQNLPGGWCILTDQLFLNVNVPQDLDTLMHTLHDGQGHELLWVAFSAGFAEPANRWTLITDQTFVDGGVPTQCANTINHLTLTGHKLRRVCLSQSFSWSAFSIVTDKGFASSLEIPGWVVNERLLALQACGWTPRMVAFSPWKLTDLGGWGFVVIADDSRPPVLRFPPLVKVSCDAVIPVTPTVPVGYSIKLSVQNLKDAPTSVDVALSEATTGGWVQWTVDPFAEGGIFGGQSPQLPALGAIQGVGGGPAPYEAGLVLARASATSGTQTSLVHGAAKILRPGFIAPFDVNTEPPVFIGLWTNPAEAVRVWREADNGPVTWCTMGGQLVNTSPRKATLTDLSFEITSLGTPVLELSGPSQAFEFYRFQGDPPAFELIEERADGGVVLAPGLSHFIYGVRLPDDFSTTGWLTVRARLQQQGRCFETSWHGALVVVRAPLLSPPVNGTWYWGSAADHVAWDAHTWPGHRYAADLVIIENGKSYVGDESDAGQDNTKFLCWDKPIRAMADGVVVEAEDKFADHPPWQDKPEGGVNFVTLQHGLNEFSHYFHLREGSIPADVSAGEPVVAGQVIGRVGDSGQSSEPHLHISYSTIDATGRGHMLAMRFRDLRTPGGDPVDVVPGTGTYVC